MTHLERYDPVAESIAKLLHPHAEVVVHDVQSNTISAVFNPLSKRSVGEPSLIDDAAALADGPDVHGPFVKTLADGRRLKSVSTVLRNDAGKAVGMMCVNLHLGELDKLQAALKAFSGITNDSTDLDSLFADDWQMKIDTFVRQHLLRCNRSLESLARSERATLVHELQEAGAFGAKGAASYIARVLGVSRATIYNDLAASESAATHETGGAS